MVGYKIIATFVPKDNGGNSSSKGCPRIVEEQIHHCHGWTNPEIHL
jgi:hypothetical protein